MWTDWEGGSIGLEGGSREAAPVRAVMMKVILEEQGVRGIKTEGNRRHRGLAILGFEGNLGKLRKNL